MRRQNGFGGGLQQIHPRARDALSANKRHGGFWGTTEADMTANYFVPSFSIRRHLHRSEEVEWQRTQKAIGNVLGRHYRMTPLAQIALKSIEQKSLIHKIRESGNQPTGAEMRDVAFNICEGLTKGLANTPDPMEVGLGRLAVFGRGRNRLGFTVEGWKGWRAPYGEMTPQGVLLLENQIALGGLALAMDDVELRAGEIASSPHLTIARTGREIREQDVRKAQAFVDELDIRSVQVGDPVIEFKAGPQQKPEQLYIRHAWDSLALVESIA